MLKILSARQRVWPEMGTLHEFQTDLITVEGLYHHLGWFWVLFPTRSSAEYDYCKGSARVPPTPFHLEGLAVEP